MTDSGARTSALIIGLLALMAMVPPLGYAMAPGDGVLWAIWRLLAAFTIITNLVVGIVFLAIAWKGRSAVAPNLFGATMLSIVLVGAVFNLLLDNMTFETVWAWLGDRIHHIVLPIAVPLWWLLFAKKGKFSWRSPFLWMMFPLGYAAYGIVRAQFVPADVPNRYIYFFMDIDKLGWAMVALNMTVIAAGFVLIGLLVVALDRKLAARAA